MNEKQREQIGRIVTLELSGMPATIGFGLEEIYTQRARAGSQSGATIVAAIWFLGEAGSRLVSDLAMKIVAVSPTAQASDALAVAVRQWLRSGEDELRKIIRRVSVASSDEQTDQAWEIARREFKLVKKDIEERLSVEQFEFQAVAQPAASKPNALLQTKGGRPPAEFWDDMWAATATALYDGTLKPKTQADVERAMTDWIESNGHSAADSTIRARARRLWDRLSATDA